MEKDIQVVHFDLNSAAGLKYTGLECKMGCEESGRRDTASKLHRKGNANIECRGTHVLHVSGHFPRFPNCLPLALPGSLLCLSPEKLQSLPVPI